MFNRNTPQGKALDKEIDETTKKLDAAWQKRKADIVAEDKIKDDLKAKDAEHLQVLAERLNKSQQELQFILQQNQGLDGQIARLQNINALKGIPNPQLVPIPPAPGGAGGGGPAPAAGGGQGAPGLQGRQNLPDFGQVPGGIQVGQGGAPGNNNRQNVPVNIPGFGNVFLPQGQNGADPLGRQNFPFGNPNGGPAQAPAAKPGFGNGPGLNPADVFRMVGGNAVGKAGNAMDQAGIIGQNDPARAVPRPQWRPELVGDRDVFAGVAKKQQQAVAQQGVVNKENKNLAKDMNKALDDAVKEAAQAQKELAEARQNLAKIRKEQQARLQRK